MVYWLCRTERDGRKGVHCYIRRLATSLRGEVMLMGDERWARALRVLVWIVIVLSLMIATAPKAY